MSSKLPFFVIALLATGSLQADETKPNAAHAKGVDFFESKIRPVLVKHCLDCHSAEAGIAEGNLYLDSRDGTRKGGDRGPAVVPNKPEQSLLLKAITHADDKLKMPPKEKRLPDSNLKDYETWINMGAPGPRENVAQEKAWNPQVTARDHWAYQAPKAAPKPSVKNTAWPKRDLDAFILAKLEAAHLEPSADAEPSTLLRRLHFDLVGLPPSPEAIKRFAERLTAKGIEAALEQEIDELLASPQFGEHWGRHWLDVARYGESSGGEANISFPYAFRYRDYVID